MSKSYETLLAALIKVEQALQNVPMVGEVYDQQHSDTHMAATLSIKDAVAQARVQQAEEVVALADLASEVNSLLDYKGDPDTEKALKKVKKLFDKKPKGGASLGM